jgi:hypothetical protein
MAHVGGLMVTLLIPVFLCAPTLFVLLKFPFLTFQGKNGFVIRGACFEFSSPLASLFPKCNSRRS